MFSIAAIRSDIQEFPRVQKLVAALCVAWVVIAAGLMYVNLLWFFIALPATVIIFLCAVYPTVPVYVMALTFPFTEFQIVSGSFNAPIVDIIGVVALAALGLRLLCSLVKQPNSIHTLRVPVGFAFLAFITVAALSVTNSWETAVSVKYLFRTLVFFYVVYIFLLVNTISTRQMLMRVIRIMYCVGVAIAAYGFAGFFVVGAPSVFQRRAIPFGIFGIYPLGSNHNLIADMMVSSIPIGFFLFSQSKNVLHRKLILLGTVFMLVVALMTFSRSAWLALCLELVLLLGLFYRSHLRALIQPIAVTAFVTLPLVAYMLIFSSQAVVDSSNQNRLIQSDIASDMVRQYPLFGAGAGTFMSFVEQNRVYMQEFGSPLDAHGFILKVGSELGILGLVTYCILLGSILVMILRAYFRATDPFFMVLCISMLMMAAGSIFFQLFQTSYFLSKLWFPLGVALAAVYQSGYRRMRHVKTEKTV